MLPRSRKSSNCAVHCFLWTMPSRARKGVSSFSVTTSWETSSPKPWKRFATTCRSSHTFKLLVGESKNLPNSSSKLDEARLDVSARGFWVTGQKTFFDIRVFNPLAKNVSLEPQSCYMLNENEKKRHYNNRVMEAEHGSLTPMVFSATSGYGREKAIQRLASIISDKRRIQLIPINSFVFSRQSLCESLIDSRTGQAYVSFSFFRKSSINIFFLFFYFKSSLL